MLNNYKWYKFFNKNTKNNNNKIRLFQLKNEDRIWIPEYMINYGDFKNKNNIKQALINKNKIYIDLTDNHNRLYKNQNYNKFYAELTEEQIENIYDNEGKIIKTINGYVIKI